MAMVSGLLDFHIRCFGSLRPRRRRSVVAFDARQSHLLHQRIQSKPVKGVLSQDRNWTRNMRNVERD